MSTREMKIQAMQQMINSREINQMLYKYRRVGKYTEKIFTEHILWFDHPINFNDPFDCWAYVDEFNTKDLINIQAVKSFLMENQLNENCLPSYNKEKLKKCVDSVLNMVGICCFSKKKDNILMWSHYSDFHKGLCIEFDTKEDSNLFHVVVPVNYVEKIPLYNHSSDRDKIIEKLIQSKAKDWAYEEEIRVLKTGKEIENNNGQAFKFNPQALKKVIFGCKASYETIHKYINLCKLNNLEHVTFSKMVQDSEGEFKLNEIII